MKLYIINRKTNQTKIVGCQDSFSDAEGNVRDLSNCDKYYFDDWCYWEGKPMFAVEHLYYDGDHLVFHCYKLSIGVSL